MNALTTIKPIWNSVRAVCRGLVSSDLLAIMITNTRDQTPLINLMTSMGDGGIEAQEAQGQSQLVASQQLPATGDWKGLEKLGVKRGDPVEGDELFVNSELPEGWEKRGTDHSMWSELVDEKGEKRASIFYKAAFYDRVAFIRLG